MDHVVVGLDDDVAAAQLTAGRVSDCTAGAKLNP
jgi:hypothetical protein